MVEGSKKTADDYETWARLYIREKNYDKAIRSYESAGDSRKKFGSVGNLHAAVKDYQDALRYSNSLDDKRRIEDKIKNIKSELGERQIIGLKLKKSLLNKLNDKIYVFITSVSLLVLSLFFSLFSLTGNTISILSQEDFRWMGLCLFVCGLILSFFYLKKRK